jgi:polysaccharide pyruvyl transferase WcaK-like protein
LHALVLALAAGKPVVGVSYAPKVSSTLRLLGLERNLVDLSSDGVDRLLGVVEHAWANRVEQGRALAPRVAAAKDRVRAATERVWEQLARQPRAGLVLDHEVAR